MRIETKSGHTILADDADYQLLFQYTWHAKRTSSGRFYACTNVPGDYTPVRRHMLMHRLLMTPPPNTVVHHINNNGLDNRRCNLQVTTQRVNMWHAHVEGGCYLMEGRWRAQARNETGKQISLGMFNTEKEANIAVKNWRYRKMLELEERDDRESKDLAKVLEEIIAG